MSRRQRRDRRIKGGRIAQSRVEISGREGTRNAADGAGASEAAPSQRGCPSAIFGKHFPGRVYFGASNMTVHINTTRHHNKPGGIDHTICTECRVERNWCNPSVDNPKVFLNTIDAVGRIVNRPVPKQKDGHTEPAINDPGSPLVLRHHHREPERPLPKEWHS